MKHLTRIERRKFRVRKKLRMSGRVRLSVHRSIQHIYAQLIDDSLGTTIAMASSLDKEIKAASTEGGKKGVAFAVGQLLAKRGVAAGIKEVTFDRGRFLYHGRVKSLADGARDGGLSF